MSKEKTLIIGGGQAACQTATSLKNKKYDGEIKIFCSENQKKFIKENKKQ